MLLSHTKKMTATMELRPRPRALLVLSTLLALVTMNLRVFDNIMIPIATDAHDTEIPPDNAAMEAPNIIVGTTSDGRLVHFVDSERIERTSDFYSGSWLQPAETFLSMKTSKIKNLESASFVTFVENRDRLRMTLDWLDWSVEHLSKWWKILGIFEDPVPYNTTITKLNAYIQNIRVDESDTTMNNTIAVVAFSPWTNENTPSQARNLSIISIAATIASLLQVGIGRVVVVGYTENDAQIVQDVFELLLKNAGSNLRPVTSYTEGEGSITKLASTEVAFVRATKEEVSSRFVQVNMPKAALVGLQSALNGRMDTWRRGQFLGTSRNASSWKYVYFTEPDLILQTRPSALPQLRDALDQGYLLAPHRLHTLPHESDVMGMKKHNRRVPMSGKFSSVIELNALEGDACCDENQGSYKPREKFGKCNKRWFMCGYGNTGDHSRLEPYLLMRLRTGTGIVNLAGSSQGMRCWPRIKGVCVPGDRPYSA